MTHITPTVLRNLDLFELGVQARLIGRRNKPVNARLISLNTANRTATWRLYETTFVKACDLIPHYGYEPFLRYMLGFRVLSGETLELHFDQMELTFTNLKAK